MKALILAGGLGTRLRPLTYTRPKHLLPIVNRPHIEHVFDLLARHGIGEVVLLTSFLAEAFEQVIASARARGVIVEVTHESEPLGTAGALKHAEAFVRSDTFVVFNGDILTDCDLDEVFAFHRARGAEASIVLTPVEDPSAFGVVPTEPDGRVLGFIEKPPAGTAPSNLINAGIYVFEPSVLGRIPSGEAHSAERELFPGLVEEGAALFATGTDAYWMDIGTPAKYLQANLDALAGRYRCTGDGKTAGGSLIGEGCTVDARAKLVAACLGPGCVVAATAIVERSVLLPGAVVGAGARVSGTILGERARVGPGLTVLDKVLADGEIVDAT